METPGAQEQAQHGKIMRDDPRDADSRQQATAGTVGGDSMEGQEIAPVDHWSAERKQFARFQADVAGHALTVLRDDGLYRHLRCRRGDSYTYGFDIITWPGYLAYAGDMGCFVFTRLPDMFGFFRGRLTERVDRGYLAEKAVAADKHDGIREYSEELFEAAIKSDYDSFVEHNELTPDQATELWECIDDDVMSSRDNMHDAVEAALNFRWAPDHVSEPRGREVFTDFWEHRLDDYTPRFWWCCYAVPWAIAQYDALAVEAGEATTVDTSNAVSERKP